MIEVKYPNGTIGDDKSYTAANNSSEYSTARNLYYEQLQEQSDRDYIEVVRCKECADRQGCIIRFVHDFGDDFYCKWGRREDAEIQYP